jgi:hypothetical protein
MGKARTLSIVALMGVAQACFNPEADEGLFCDDGNCPPDQVCGTDNICRWEPDSDDDAGALPSDAGIDAAGEDTAFALGTNTTTTGVLTRIGVPSLTVTQNYSPGAVSPDPTIRVLGDKVYVVNRFVWSRTSWSSTSPPPSPRRRESTCRPSMPSTVCRTATPRTSSATSCS